MKRVYQSPEGFMHWCTECGACLEAKGRAAIMRRVERHYATCNGRRSDVFDVKTGDPINLATGRPFTKARRAA